MIPKLMGRSSSIKETGPYLISFVPCSGSISAKIASSSQDLDLQFCALSPRLFSAEPFEQPVHDV
jgi:hypothetical protein